MRNLLWIVLAAIVLIGGYVLITGKSPTEVITTQEPEVTAPEALETTDQDETATETVAEEAKDAAETLAETADEAVAETEAAAEDVKSDVDAAVEQATDAATEAATDAAEATTEATTDNSGAATETAPAAAETAAPASDIADLLTVDGFDYDKVITYVDGSDLDMAVKVSSKAALEKARDNPELLKTVLEQLRENLGISQ